MACVRTGYLEHVKRAMCGACTKRPDLLMTALMTSLMTPMNESKIRIY